jgi:hypothetical protein
LMYGIIPMNISSAPTPPKILLVSIDIFSSSEHCLIALTIKALPKMRALLWKFFLEELFIVPFWVVIKRRKKRIPVFFIEWPCFKAESV